MGKEPVLHRSCERIRWALEQTPNPGEFPFSWIQADLWVPVSRGMYLLHCSLLWLCKNIFKVKAWWQSWALWGCSWSERRCVPLAVHLAMSLHTASFHPTILATGVVLTQHSLKRIPITSLCFMFFPSTQLACFRRLLCARHFLQNGTRLSLP